MIASPIEYPKPEKEILDKCAEVMVDGDKHKPKTMRDWVIANCRSLVWWEEWDMSDINSWEGPDYAVIFYFSDEKDATMFGLKWL